jgi:hypothetical protein
MVRIGIILIVFGVIYLIKPDIYRRWIWKETDITQKLLSPKQYILFMRILGGIFVMVGLYLILRHE